jgi:hypothetical protein
MCNMYDDYKKLFPLFGHTTVQKRSGTGNSWGRAISDSRAFSGKALDSLSFRYLTVWCGV